MGRAFFSVALLLLGPLGGCFVSRGPIDLRDASTRVVRFGVDASRGGICPGQPVALDIELTAEVGSQTLRLTRTRHDLNDAIFDMRQIRLASAQGRFDEDGRFFPDPDPSVSAQSGFVFYVDVPRGPTFSVRYPPVYECTTPFGREGQIGGDGLKGADAIFEDETGPGFGGAEAPSARGFLGGEGGRGGDGPDLTIYVTWVRTPDYTKLLAARAEGDVQGVTLRAPGTPLNVMARGGVGGAGGAGGQGATGLEHVLRYTKRHHAAVSERAPGGSGGAGGTGGGGGGGGTVRVVLDERFELESWVEVDVRGGAGGAGGRGGSGGAGNNGGWTAAAHAGIPGQPGRDGPAGPRGNVTIERGDVREHFQNLGAIVALETL